jgi:hypothetical protein
MLAAVSLQLDCRRWKVTAMWRAEALGRIAVQRFADTKASPTARRGRYWITFSTTFASEMRSNEHTTQSVSFARRLQPLLKRDDLICVRD